MQPARADVQAVGGLRHVAAELVDLLRQRGQPVRLVQSQMGHAAQGRGGVGEGRDRRDARRQLADLAQVHIDAVDRAGAGEREAVLGQFAGAAHLGEDLAQPVTGLGGAGRPGRDDDLAAGHQRGRQERLGVGQIRLDDQVPAEQGARRDPPDVRLAARLGRVHLGADRAQHVDGHADVRHGGQRAAGVADLDALVEARAGQQQRAHELRRGGGVDRDLAAFQSTAAVHGHRQRAAAVVVDPGAELTQRVDHSVQGTLVRAGVAVEPDGTVGERGDRWQEAHHRAGVADVDRGRSAQARGEHTPGLAGAVRAHALLDLDAHRAQGTGHQQGVAGAQRAAQPAGLGGEGGEDKGAVGDRLGPGHVDRRVDGSARVRGGPEGGFCGVRGHGPTL